MGISGLVTWGSNIELVTNKILNADNECKNYGIKNIFVSGLTVNHHLPSDFVYAVNSVLKLDSVKYNYNSIKNSNILPDNLWQDGLGLNNFGMYKLLNIFLVSLKKKDSLSNFITHSKMIPKSFNSTEHHDIPDEKLELGKFKYNAQRK